MRMSVDRTHAGEPNKTWPRSSEVEHRPDKAAVVGSIPTVATSTPERYSAWASISARRDAAVRFPIPSKVAINASWLARGDEILFSHL